jgi:hypothetical protein
MLMSDIADIKADVDAHLWLYITSVFFSLSNEVSTEFTYLFFCN